MSDIETKPTVVKQENGQPFKRNTRHPTTGRVEKAEWIPNHFGRNMWGVKFSADPRVYHPREIPTPNASGREPYTSKAPGNK